MRIFFICMFFILSGCTTLQPEKLREVASYQRLVKGEPLNVLRDKIELVEPIVFDYHQRTSVGIVLAPTMILPAGMYTKVAVNDEGAYYNPDDDKVIKKEAGIPSKTYGGIMIPRDPNGFIKGWEFYMVTYNAGTTFQRSVADYDKVYQSKIIPQDHIKKIKELPKLLSREEFKKLNNEE